MNKKITLQRFLSDKVTFGKLAFEWLPIHKDVYTIELPWQDNKPNISCIPQGLYNCKPYSSPKFKNVWQILNVPNRTDILIHTGNFASDVPNHKSDTEGCILVGLGIEENTPMVTRSKLAMEYLHDVLEGDNFILEVKNGI